MKRTIILSSALLACLTTLAQTNSVDSLAAAEHNSAWTTVLAGVSRNPAVMVDRYGSSYSEIFAELDHENANDCLLYQTGDGHTLGQIKADSYLRLTPTMTVWGEASYRTGKRRSVKWNSTADFLLLYPYVMADTLGGDLNTERYAFTGGWAARKGKWDLGAELQFRAEQEYRTTDPRPRSIVTDLELNIGAAFHAASWRFGLSAGARFYKQTNSVTFYREAGVIPEYQMVGLGMDYKRFSGSNTSTYYKATGWIVGLDIRPESGNGAYLSAGFDYTPYKHILPNQNALPISTLYLQNARAEAGWKQRNGRVGWAALVGATYEKRTGDEHVAGSSSSSEYKIVDILTMYHAHDADYYCSAAFDYRAARDTWDVSLRAGLRDYAASYIFPERKMDWKKVYGTLRSGWMHSFAGRKLLSCSVGAAYFANTTASTVMPYATMDEANTELMNHTFANCTADYFSADASVRFDAPLRKASRYGIFGRVAGRWLGNESYNSTALTVAVGLSF